MTRSSTHQPARDSTTVKRVGKLPAATVAAVLAKLAELFAA